MDIVKIIIISLGHLATDIAQGAIPLLLPYLKEAFNLSYFAVGLVFLFSSIFSSIIQPLFGLYSDRYQSLWLLPLGCLAAMIGVAAIGYAPNYYFVLAAVTFSGLGIAAYHPEASKTVFYLSGQKKATAMSLFSLGGNLGFAMGPIFATFLLGWYGLRGTAGFLVLGVAMSTILLFVYSGIKDKVDHCKLEIGKEEKTSPKKGFFLTVPIILLMGVVTIRSWLHMGLMMNIPLYYIDFLKMDTIYGSSLLTTFLIFGAVGTLIGGPLADRIGLKRILYFSFISAAPLMYLLFQSSGTWTYIITAITGAFLISTFSVTTVYAQKVMPQNIGLASGLVLGFAIGTGGIGTTLLGLVADHFGLMVAIHLMMLLPFIGLLLIKPLPDPDRK